MTPEAFIGAVIAIIAAIFASTGFWSFMSSRFQRRDQKQDTTEDLKEKDTEIEGQLKTLDALIKALQKQNDLQSKMLRGIGHDRIIYLGEIYIKQGYITSEEFENLHDYLFIPYQSLGGNGTAEKIMNEVRRLPTKPPRYPENGGEYQ